MKTVYLFLLFLMPVFAWANIEITEIMYDVEGTDTGREWVEIFNSGDMEVDITGWKFYEAETNHKLTSDNSNDFIIFADGYVVIADNPEKFLLDFPNFTGAVLDSSFSLNNNGEEIILRDTDLNDISKIFYDVNLGAKGDGNSLQKINGVWEVGLSTPGEKNIENFQLEPLAQNSADIEAGPPKSLPADATHQTLQAGESFGGENRPNITAYAGKDRTMIAGASGEFRGEAYGLEKTPLANARYLWNFGDGVIKEGQNVNHFYRYVGEYTVYLDVSSGGYSSSDALVVKVIPNEIFISEVKTGTDGFIELYNNSKNEINISGWRFRQGSQTFTFSNNSFIRPNSYLVIPISSSGLLLTYEKGKTELLYPGSFLADEFNYSGILKEGESYSRIMENKSTDSFVGKETPGVKNSSQISNSPASTSRGEAGKVQISNQNQISKDLSYDSPVVDEVVVNKQNIEVGLEEEGKKNLEANVIAATEADEGKLYYYFLAVLGLSLFSGVGVYLVRRQGGI